MLVGFSPKHKVKRCENVKNRGKIDTEPSQEYEEIYHFFDGKNYTSREKILIKR